MTGAQMLRAEGREEGRAESEALAILRFLERRGIALSDGERVRSCRDLDQLERWLDRAVSVQTAAELFH